MKQLFFLMCVITLGVFIMAHTATAQTSFPIPPKSYPTKVPFKCDAGVDRYWHVTRRFGMPTTKKTEPEQELDKPKTNPNKVYVSTDDAIKQLPEFPGGMQAFMSHISKSIRYPWK